MTGLPHGSDEALIPVRKALLTAAEARAELIRHDARDQAQALLAAARGEAERAISEAVSEGETSARSDAVLRSARVRRQANEIVLAQQDALRRELQQQVREAALNLRQDASYPTLLAVLSEHGRAVLGAEATVIEDPTGGVIVQAGSRRLDLSLPALAARTLDAMSPQVSRLWTP
jgi:vacuolar-type H+-ATPase subunit E/Vma4